MAYKKSDDQEKIFIFDELTHISYTTSRNFKNLTNLYYKCNFIYIYCMFGYNLIFYIYIFIL